MPNPAVLYCQKAGGHYEIGALADGNQIGLCKFSDNSVIEAWTLWSGPMAPENAQLMNVLK